MRLANVEKSNGLLLGPASQDRGFFVCGLYQNKAAVLCVLRL